MSMKKCLYCGKVLDENSVIDFCERCGVGVFGPKMFKTILKNMNNAREKGDLEQGAKELNFDRREDF